MNYALAFPEILLAVSSLALLLGAAWGGDRSFIAINRLSLFVVACAVLLTLSGDAGTAFHGLFVTDGFRAYVKTVLLFAAFFCLVLAPFSLGRMSRAKPEYPILVLLAVLGMMVLVSSNDLISLYLGLELQNIALYVLAGFRRDDKRSGEAALKYFTLSALSSCVMLFGMSFVYGAGGSTGFEAIAAALAEASGQGTGLAVGLVLVLAGFAFKISAVPFHMWAPDVYEGAPTPVTAFFATAPKIAAVSVLAGLLTGPFADLSSVWQPVVSVLASASMILGAFGGLLQTNMKRLMAYSSVTNIGMILVGVACIGAGADLALQREGAYGFLVYLALYFAGTLGVFSVLSLLEARESQAEDLSDFAGLSRTHPFLALALCASLFSLAGIPPLAGFLGKYLIFLAAVKAELVLLAVLGVLTSVVAAGYYLRIVKLVYFDKRSDSLHAPEGHGAHKCLCAGLALFVAVFLFYPAPLLDAARMAVESLL